MSVAELGRSESAATPAARVTSAASRSVSAGRRAARAGERNAGAGPGSRLRPTAAGAQRRAHRRRYSIPSGPCDSPERNWRTNGFSELNSSSAGPDSTIRPFHSTEMCSATRRALMMSCVITT